PAALAPRGMSPPGLAARALSWRRLPGVLPLALAAAEHALPPCPHLLLSPLRILRMLIVVVVVVSSRVRLPPSGGVTRPRTRTLGTHSYLARADRSAFRRHPLPWGVQLAERHRQHRPERTFVPDPGGDQPGDDDGDDEGPRGGEEPELDAQLPFHGQHQQEHRCADPPGDVASAPGEGSFGRPEPHRVDSVHLVVGSYAHADPCSSP